MYRVFYFEWYCNFAMTRMSLAKEKSSSKICEKANIGYIPKSRNLVVLLLKSLMDELFQVLQKKFQVPLHKQRCLKSDWSMSRHFKTPAFYIHKPSFKVPSDLAKSCSYFFSHLDLDFDTVSWGGSHLAAKKSDRKIRYKKTAFFLWHYRSFLRPIFQMWLLRGTTNSSI